MIPLGVNRPLVRFPYVTITIMVVNTLVHLLLSLRPDFDDTVAAYGYVAGHGSLITLFTHMFMHGGWGHLIGNMFFFAVPGLKMEDALGPVKFLIFYLGCGVAACGVQEIFNDGVPLPLVGASGAIAGVMGGFMALYPHSLLRFVTFLGVRVISFRLPAWLFLGFWFARELYSMQQVGDPGEGGVAFAAHVGGFTAGVTWAWAFFGFDNGNNMDDIELARRGYRYVPTGDESWIGD